MDCLKKNESEVGGPRSHQMQAVEQRGGDTVKRHLGARQHVDVGLR